jgi:hypothetical protein
MSSPHEAGSSATPGRVAWWRHSLNAAALVALLGIAAVVADTAPSEAGWQAPIEVRGGLGETLTGRNVQAVVTDVRAADSVVASNGWAGTTTGVWVVVDASVSSVVDEEGALLGTAVLRVGERSYSASERPDLGSIAETSLRAGIPVTGPLMFEVPRSALSSGEGRSARIELGISRDPRVDSLLVVPIDLSTLEVEESLETTEPVEGATGADG